MIVILGESAAMAVSIGCWRRCIDGGVVRETSQKKLTLEQQILREENKPIQEMHKKHSRQREQQMQNQRGMRARACLQ